MKDLENLVLSEKSQLLDDSFCTNAYNRQIYWERKLPRCGGRSDLGDEG